MKHIAYILYLAFIIAFVSACSKEEMGSDGNMPNITFGVSGLDISTKGLITNGSFESGKVYVYGVKNNTEPIYDSVSLSKSEGNNWTPTNSNNIKQWASGSSYSFYGYTKSPTGTPGNGASCTIANNSGAMKITVSQPSKYSEPDMVDYMLSHAYKVADGKNYRTVMLYMQHAMAWVEIEVWKEQENHEVKLKEIKLSNIYRSAVMQCDFQAIAGSGEKNVWSVQLGGKNDQVYSVGPFATPADGVTKLGYMRVLAIPQQITNNTSLFVEYTVTEPSGEKTYEQTFYLKDYVPYVWESGHKIKYTLNINTGVHLEASIADWKEGGYTEGIILPQEPTN